MMEWKLYSSNVRERERERGEGVGREEPANTDREYGYAGYFISPIEHKYIIGEI